MSSKKKTTKGKAKKSPVKPSKSKSEMKSSPDSMETNPAENTQSEASKANKKMSKKSSEVSESPVSEKTEAESITTSSKKDVKESEKKPAKKPAKKQDREERKPAKKPMKKTVKAPKKSSIGPKKRTRPVPKESKIVQADIKSEVKATADVPEEPTPTVDQGSSHVGATPVPSEPVRARAKRSLRPRNQTASIIESPSKEDESGSTTQIEPVVASTLENQREQVVQSTSDIEFNISTIEHNLAQVIVQDTPQSTESQSSNIDKIDFQVPSRWRKLFKFLIRPLAPLLPVEKMMLPREKHLDQRLIFYFSEAQIVIGILIILLSFVLRALGADFIYLIIGIIIGISVVLTSTGSEEIHITNSRILVRRITLVDRFFQVPQDSQYIIQEIVSFDLGRAPVNRALFFSSFFIWFPLIYENLRTWYIGVILLIVFLPTVFISLRLSKRSLTFYMSGNHVVYLGLKKGIPLELFNSFVNIVLEQNIIEQH